MCIRTAPRIPPENCVADQVREPSGRLPFVTGFHVQGRPVVGDANPYPTLGRGSCTTWRRGRKPEAWFLGLSTTSGEAVVDNHACRDTGDAGEVTLRRPATAAAGGAGPDRRHQHPNHHLLSRDRMRIESPMIWVSRLSTRANSSSVRSETSTPSSSRSTSPPILSTAPEN